MSDKSIATQTALDSTAVKMVSAQTLSDRIHQIRENIARRAYELFHRSDGAADRDLEHWFQAESEFLHPVHMNVKETNDALTVEAEVPGFDPSELQVSVDGQQLTIIGKKESNKEQKRAGKIIYQEQCSSELLRVLDLPVDVDTAKAKARLKNGVLELTLPKSTRAEIARINVSAA
jgi:HSP20 family protein